MLLVVVIIHFAALHVLGSTGASRCYDSCARLPFGPSFVAKDCVAVVGILILLAVLRS